MRERITNDWDGTEYPPEVIERIRSRARKIATAGRILMTYANAPVEIRSFPVYVNDKTYFTTCIFVGGLQVCSLETNEI